MNTQKGFGLTGILIILITVMLVGMGGMYVLQNTGQVETLDEEKRSTKSLIGQSKDIKQLIEERNTDLENELNTPDSLKDITFKEDQTLNNVIEPPESSSDDRCLFNAYNCIHFSTQAEAQAVFEACGGVSNDIHGLDVDNNGIACERLP